MRISALLCMAFAIAACGGGSSEAPKTAGQPVVAAKALPSVSDVLALVYDNSYQVPDGFLVDARAATARSYTIHHVLDASNSFEVCTDDFSEAEAMEAADNASRSVQGRFVGAVETDRYFEFARELSYTASIGNIDDITSPGFGRVFKCSDTNRNGVDRSLHSGYAGRINARPLSGETLRQFTEYLWQFAFFPTARKKVLESYGGVAADGYSHTLLLGFATTGAGGDGCDRIEVVDWTFTSNRETGEVDQRFDVVSAYSAKLVNGVPTLCN